MDTIDLAIVRNFDEAIKKINVAKQFVSCEPYSSYEILRSVSKELSQAEVTLYNILGGCKNGKETNKRKDSICNTNKV